MSTQFPLVSEQADQGLIHQVQGPETLAQDSQQPSAPMPLWFDLNPQAELLAEHFPGFAVVPASIIYALVVQCLQQRTNNGLWQLQNLRLQRPWRPGHPVQLRLEPHQTQWHFALEQAETGLLCRGVMLPLVSEVHDAA